jgi:diguanylate cyclase (GGDEF)-like protein
MLQPLDLRRDATAISADSVLEVLPSPVLLLDEDDAVAYANATAAAMFGGWILSLPFHDIFPAYLRSEVDADQPTLLRLATHKEQAYDAWFAPAGGGRLCVSLWPSSQVPQRNDSAAVDELTGLAKRSVLMAALDQACTGSRRGDSSVAIHCLDLDRFKTVNDTLGHGIGDQLLRKVADRLRVACREGDVVARVGGDEFVILQCGITGPQDATRLAVRLVDLIGRTYVLNGHTINIGASVGVALASEQLQARDILRQSDLALYEAKRSGRGRFRFFEPKMDEQLRHRRELEIDLRRALALKQFEINYQPFVDVASGTVIGFEALLRWQHPTRGSVPPLDFIAVAEENGLIVKIGDWVLRTACKAAAEWPNDLIVAVNVSPVQFKADTLLATVSSALANSGLPPQRLEIEITEGALLDDTDNVLATLHALRDLGVRISMDDFGTGYSSLSYLQKFPFNKIKIDRSFVIGDDADSAAILTAVSGLGASLGITITAEGVETVAQFDRIREQNCTHVQGYLTGRPMPAGEIPSFLSPGS